MQSLYFSKLPSVTMIIPQNFLKTIKELKVWFVEHFNIGGHINLKYIPFYMKKRKNNQKNEYKWILLKDYDSQKRLFATRGLFKEELIKYACIQIKYDISYFRYLSQIQNNFKLINN